MGRRGPKPLTDDEKLADGINLVPAELPDCPGDLVDEAKEEYARLKPLVEGRIACATDYALLVQYCTEWAIFRKLCRACTDAPPLISGAQGGEKANPLFAMRDRSSGRLLSLEDKLGLTPACRSRMRTEPEEKTTEPAAQEFFP